jgi:hypothetical protein
VLGYALTGIFVGMIGFARNWSEVLVYRVLAWFGRGAREPPRDALLADSVDKIHYGHAFDFHRAMDTMGAIIGPLTAFFLIPVIPLTNVFFVSFIPGLLAVLIIAVGLKERTGKTQKSVKGLIGNIGSLPNNYRLFVFVMFIFGIGNFNRTLLLLRVQNALTPSTGIIVAGSLAVLLYTLRNISQALADYGVGALSDRISKKILLAMLGFFLFGLMCIRFVYAIDISHFVLLFVLSGVSAATYTALERAYAADLLPPSVRGTGYGVLHTVDGIGDFVSSFIVGTLWTIVSSTTAFVYSATVSFLATILLLGLTKASSKL